MWIKAATQLIMGCKSGNREDSKAMKKILMIMAVLVAGCAMAGSVSKISPDAAEKWIAKTPDVQIVDVRELDEFSGGHLEGAVLLPWRQPDFDKRALSSLDPKKPVLVYCRSGRRSTAASEVLSKLGFVELRSLDGGIVAWQKAGKPVSSAE